VAPPATWRHEAAASPRLT